MAAIPLTLIARVYSSFASALADIMGNISQQTGHLQLQEDAAIIFLFQDNIAKYYQLQWYSHWYLMILPMLCNGLTYYISFFRSLFTQLTCWVEHRPCKNLLTSWTPLDVSDSNSSDKVTRRKQLTCQRAGFRKGSLLSSGAPKAWKRPPHLNPHASIPRSYWLAVL